MHLEEHSPASSKQFRPNKPAVASFNMLFVLLLVAVLMLVLPIILLVSVFELTLFALLLELCLLLCCLYSCLFPCLSVCLLAFMHVHCCCLLCMPLFSCNYNTHLIFHLEVASEAPATQLLCLYPLPLLSRMWSEEDVADQALFTLLSHVPSNSIFLALH